MGDQQSNMAGYKSRIRNCKGPITWRTFNPEVYGCRIVAKFNKHNLYSIHTFYIQYTHFIFNTHILYSIHSFYIQYTHFIFNNYRNIFNSFAKTFNNLVKYSIQHLKYSVNYTVKYSMRPKKYSIKQPQNIFNSF
jgi:hypothetical protein